MKNILVTGGSGYVGSVLVPKLLKEGYDVKIIGLSLYSDNLLLGLRNTPKFTFVKGDIRDGKVVEKELAGIDAVIHLACVASDITDELDPRFLKSVNLDGTKQLIRLSRITGAKRFIFASSSSVYGESSKAEVTEDLPPAPLTVYSKYKALCEEYLRKLRGRGFDVLIIRPAQIFGYSPRFRMDLSVNKMIIDGLVKKKITVYGGKQTRALIHIGDITDLYTKALVLPKEKIAGHVYNAGMGNYTILELAKIIKDSLDDPKLRLEVLSAKDNRSYRISSKKIERELNFRPRLGIEEGVADIKKAYHAGKIPHPYTDSRYYNIKRISQMGNQF